jgi:hypothetical protein
MMTMNISATYEMKAFVEAQMAQGSRSQVGTL